MGRRYPFDGSKERGKYLLKFLVYDIFDQRSVAIRIFRFHHHIQFNFNIELPLHNFYFTNEILFSDSASFRNDVCQ